MSNKQTNPVLSIAGFDPCGGAGVLADVQAMQQLAVPCMGAVTALTYQNEERLTGVEWKTFEQVKNQLDLLWEAYHFDVAKIGIVRDWSLLQQLVDYLVGKNEAIKIIWDPILRSSSGYDFITRIEESQLSQVLEKVYLVTPNRQEFAQLTRVLPSDRWASFCLLKGGHSTTDDTSDELWHKEKLQAVLKGKRRQAVEKHGTGCVLSAVVAAQLAKGQELQDACQTAKIYIESFLQTGKNKLGYHFEVKI